MRNAIVVTIVMKPLPEDPVGHVLETLGSMSLGDGGVVQIDPSVFGLSPGAPWKPGKWLDISHPSFPAKAFRHMVNLVDTGKSFGLFLINIAYLGQKRRVPAEISEVAVELARKWIESTPPAAVYITGSKGSPSEGAMAAPSEFRDLTWWSWVPGVTPLHDDGDGVVTAFAGGTVVRLSDEFHSTIKVPESVAPALGLTTVPRLRVGL